MKEHGEHNFKVCKHLELTHEIECNDWVVTTAFYAAIHFLDSKLFPCTYESETFQNIDEAHRSLRKTSKHQTRGFLIKKKLTEHAGEYEFLLETCHSARYRNYKIQNEISSRAVRVVSAIRQTCN